MLFLVASATYRNPRESTAIELASLELELDKPFENIDIVLMGDDVPDAFLLYR